MAKAFRRLVRRYIQRRRGTLAEFLARKQMANITFAKQNRLRLKDKAILTRPFRSS